MKTAIRPEDPDDYAAIDQLNRLAFGGNDEARLVNAIRQARGFNSALSLVAVHLDKVVGHILFSPILIETDQTKMPALALAPMAVLPEFQRQGIGTDLVGEGLEVCRRLGHAIVIVVGHPNYYPRFGFVPAASCGLQAPFDVPDEAFMVLFLASSGMPDGISGVVRYPSAFDGV